MQIGGTVHQGDDLDQGIPGATVTLLERALDATTDERGRFTFSGVPEGSYTLVISAPGADEQRREIQVPSGSYDVSI
ncbi:MAG: carboxypeptidase regulatory-like domain-containing protein [Anaerolineae bacterium]